MIDSVVRTSVASAFGGALAIENGGLVSLCGDTVLDKNEAKTAGGAVYMSASTLTVISGCPAELNSLGNTSIISGNAAPKGGALYIVGASTVYGGTEAGSRGPHLSITETQQLAWVEEAGALLFWRRLRVLRFEAQGSASMATRQQVLEAGCPLMAVVLTAAV